MAFNRFERGRSSTARPETGVARLYLGCVLTGGGLGYLALKGIGGSPHWLYDVVALALPFAGTRCMGLGR